MSTITQVEHDFHRCHCDQWGRDLVHCDSCHCGEEGRHVYAGLNERGYSSWKWVPA